jgi:hypothetical protein
VGRRSAPAAAPASFGGDAAARKAYRDKLAAKGATEHEINLLTAYKFPATGR